MKIMVTGSRYWEDRSAIQRALAAAVGDHGEQAELYVGDCPTGADRIARGWWSAAMSTDTLHVATAHGNRAYAKLARNQLLVDAMPDVVLGFVLYGPGMSRGTYDTLNRARESGLHLVVQERPAPAELVNIHAAWHH